MRPLTKMCLEAKSASLLLLPAIDNVIKGDTSAAFMSRAKLLINLAAIGYFDESLCTHPTAGALPQKIAMVLFFTSALDSTTRKRARFHITSRSEFFHILVALNLCFEHPLIFFWKI